MIKLSNVKEFIEYFLYKFIHPWVAEAWVLGTYGCQHIYSSVTFGKLFSLSKFSSLLSGTNISDFKELMWGLR